LLVHAKRKVFIMFVGHVWDKIFFMVQVSRPLIVDTMLNNADN
jgi:hypothetical protein